MHTPEWLWLSTGIRAVDHCVEGICANEAHPYGDAQALQGLTLLSRGLPRVKADPSDLEARLDCQMGTWLSMGPLASGVPMGASHGIGYVLGAVFDVPHGHTSCIMLPAVMRWNKTVNAERQALVSVAMAAPGKDAGDALAFARVDISARSRGGAIGKAGEFELGAALLGSAGDQVPRAIGHFRLGGVGQDFEPIADGTDGIDEVMANPRAEHCGKIGRLELDDIHGCSLRVTRQSAESA